MQYPPPQQPPQKPPYPPRQPVQHVQQPQGQYGQPYPQQQPPQYPQQPLPQPYGQPPAARPQRRPAARPKPKRNWLLILGVVSLVGMMFFVLAMILGAAVLYGSGNILPGVKAGGVDVGGMSKSEAAAKIAASWQSEGILIRDGERTWAINPGELGLGIDANATADAAYDWGRSQDNFLGGIQSLFTGADVEPRLQVDLNQTSSRLEELRSVVELPSKNAGIQLVNGQVQPVPPVQGRILDRESTLLALQSGAAGELADGALDLVMVSVAPAVTDASPLMAQAQALLSSPMTIEAYDPIDDESQVWTLQPTEWGQWLIANQNPSSATGLSLSLDTTGLKSFLSLKSNELPNPRYLNVDESVAKINEAMASNNLNTWVRVYHDATTYTVQAGENLSTIGYDTGIPYPYIQAANPDVTALSPGDQIVLPSKDALLPLPIVRNKRIVVSIPSQEMWAYENGQLIWNWKVSTGIARSPTSPGIFQIQSHDVNAFGAQWNLYMPHFMGVYHPGPGVEVMNGFHGFPTDASGGYLLWTSSLGHPATYGCILLSLENAEALYNWAEEGVVVQILG